MKQLIKFNAVGAVNTAVDFACFSVLSFIGLGFAAAQAISYGAGMVNSYMLNKKWTFKRKWPFNKRSVIWFAAVNIAALLIGLSVIVILKSIDKNISVYAAKAVSLVFTTGINYAGAKFLVFKKSDEHG